MTKAPFTQEQVDNLNAYQKSRRFHPFTCPGSISGGCPARELIATQDGWVCECGEYTQDWAHDFMMTIPKPTPPTPTLDDMAEARR